MGRDGKWDYDLILFVIFFLSCVFALCSLSLSISTCVSEYIYLLFFCCVCCVRVCCLSHCCYMLTWAELDEGWYCLLLGPIYIHVSIKDTSPRGYIVPLSSPGSFVLIGPSPNSSVPILKVPIHSSSRDLYQLTRFSTSVVSSITLTKFTITQTATRNQKKEWGENLDYL